MNDIHKRIENYLNEETEDEYLPDEDVVLMDRIFDGRKECA